MDRPPAEQALEYLAEAGYGRDPRLCAAADGRAFAAWISWTDAGEAVRLAERDAAGQWSAAVRCTPWRERITGLAIAPWDPGVIVAWIDEEGLRLSVVEPDGAGSPPATVIPARRAPAGVALDAQDDRFALAYTVRDPGGRRVEALIDDEPRRLLRPQRISDRPGHNLCPAVTRTHGGAWIAWQAMSASGSRIMARRLAVDGARAPVVLVAAGEGIAAQPALTRTLGGGAWVAWQADWGADAGPGLVRWIELAHLDPDRGVRRPAAPPVGVERRGVGEDQGFEAPQLATGEDGHLIVIGRGSQSVRRQDLGAAGFSPRVQLDEPGWGCRGRRYSVCRVGPELLVAGRERRGIAVRTLAADGLGVDGAPVLRQPDAEPRVSIVPPPPPRITIAGHRVLFGDIHQHTAASDGTGTHAETFFRARHRYGDQLVAVADHEAFLGKRTAPGEWFETCRWADEFYVPGELVTLHASEWTGAMHPGPGHKVVYHPPGGGPLFSRDDPATQTSAGLVEACRRVGALIVPHHVGWTGADMDHHDEAVQPCWEIVSCHGAYERAGQGPIGTRGDDKPGQFVADALDAGLRFGLVGGSDGHGLDWHHGVCRIRDSHRSGLTAVLCEELTREAVLDALARRRCYATSGAKIGLWLEIEGRPMGAALRLVGAPRFALAVSGTAAIERVSLVSNGGREIDLAAAGTSVEAAGTLPALVDQRWQYYFARVVQSDGEVAWSSPIWVERAD